MSMLSRFATLGGAPTDPYWANVSYMLVGNGANGTNTNIKDSSSNNLATTVNGSVVISTAQSKYGGSSVYFPGASSDYLSISSSEALPSGTEDFTIELWLYYTNTTGRQSIIGGVASNSLFLTKGSDTAGDNTISVGLSLVSTNERFSVTFSNNTWYYLVAQRASGVISFYLDGNKQTVSGAGVGSANLVASGASISYSNYAPLPQNFNGYMYDLRVTKGVARYSGSTMTVPTAPLPIG